MGRKGLGHTRTYVRNDVQTFPVSPYSHARRCSANVKSLDSPQKCGDVSQKKHFRHSSATQTQTHPDVSPVLHRRCVELPPDSDHFLLSEKFAQLHPRFMVGSACVSSKRRGYWRSKRVRDQKNSPQQHKRCEESPSREVCEIERHEDVALPTVVAAEAAVPLPTDETETEGDDESQQASSNKTEGETEYEGDDDYDDDDCLLCAPKPLKFGEEFDDNIVADEYEEREEQEEEEEDGEESKVLPEKSVIDLLPSPVLETIFKHSDVCTRYALGYSCVRLNRIAINSGLEWCSYHHETVENLLLNEAEHPPVDNYALIHPYITPMLRLAYADWLCNIARDTDQPPSVLPLAFRLFDRTLSSVESFPLQQLQPLAAACFWIASKIRGTESLMASDMCVFSGGLFSAQVICSLERFVMKAVNFRLMPPTTRDFLEMYLDNSTRLLSSGYIFTVDETDEAENLLCPSTVEFDEWAERVRQFEGITVAECMSFLETLSLHVYSLAPCQPSVLSAAIFSVSLAIVTGTSPLRSALVRYSTHAFLIEDTAVRQCCSLLMNTCVMVQEVEECKFLRSAYPAFFPNCYLDEQ